MLCVATIGIHFDCRGQTEELFIADWITLTDRGKTLVFITHQEDLPEIPFPTVFHLRYAAKNCPLKIQLEHRSENSGETGIQRNREVEGAYLSVLD
jgi:hypothetical protein